MIRKILKKLKKKMRILKNRLGSKKRGRKIRTNYTLISNNCWAGLTYEYLDKEFISPTIGCYFMASDYLKFISNLKYYMKCDLEFIETNESKYYEYLNSIGQSSVIIGKLDDVEVIFLHYSSFDEACIKWNKRKERIDYEHIIYKFNDQNLCNEEDLKKFNDLNLENKICFTAKKYNYNGFIQLKKYKNKPFVKDDVYSYHKYFDIVKYIQAREGGSYGEES